MAVKKYYRTRVRQHGGSKTAKPKSKLVSAGINATKGNSFKSKLLRRTKTVIDPRKWASAGVGLARGAYSGILGTARVAGTVGAQLAKFGYQTAKVASAKAKLVNTLRNVTGYNRKALNTYEAARKKVAKLDSEYRAQLGRTGKANDSNLLAAKEQLNAAKTTLSPSNTGTAADKTRVFDNKFKQLVAQGKSRTEIQQALANAVADKQRTAQTGLADSQKKLQKLLEGQNIVALRQLSQQDKSQLDATADAEKIKQIENAKEKVNEINTAAAEIRTKTAELAKLGVKENTSIGARVKSFFTGKTSLTKGVANLRNSLGRRQNRVAVTGQSLKRTGSKLVDVVRNSAAAAKKGYEASKKAVGVGEGYTGLAKSLYRVPASLIGQALSTLGKEVGQIKFTGPSGATVYASDVGRKLLQAAQGLYSGQEKSTAIILSQIETENQNVQKTRANLGRNETTLEKDINDVRNKYKNAEPGTIETEDQTKFREKQGKLVNNAMTTVDAYRDAIKQQQDARTKLRKLELQLISASPVAAVELQKQIRTEKQKIIQESAKASKQQAALGSLVSSLGSDTGSAAQEIKAIADTTNNYYSGVKKLNESEQLLQTSVKNVVSSFKNEQALINTFNADDIKSIAESTKINAQILTTNPDVNNVKEYLAASQNIDRQLKTAKDPATIEQLKNAKNIIVARINMASASEYIPALGQTANPVVAPAVTAVTASLVAPAPASGPAAAPSSAPGSGQVAAPANPSKKLGAQKKPEEAENKPQPPIPSAGEEITKNYKNEIPPQKLKEVQNFLSRIVELGSKTKSDINDRNLQSLKFYGITPEVANKLILDAKTAAANPSLVPSDPSLVPSESKAEVSVNTSAAAETKAAAEPKAEAATAGQNPSSASGAALAEAKATSGANTSGPSTLVVPAPAEPKLGAGQNPAAASEKLGAATGAAPELALTKAVVPEAANTSAASSKASKASVVSAQNPASASGAETKVKSGAAATTQNPNPTVSKAVVAGPEQVAPGPVQAAASKNTSKAEQSEATASAQAPVQPEAAPATPVSSTQAVSEAASEAVEVLPKLATGAATQSENPFSGLEPAMQDLLKGIQAGATTVPKEELKPEQGAAPTAVTAVPEPQTVAAPAAPVSGSAQTPAAQNPAAEKAAQNPVGATILTPTPPVTVTAAPAAPPAQEDTYMEVVASQSTKSQDGGSRKLNKKHLKKSKKARVSKNKLHKRKSRKNTN